MSGALSLFGIGESPAERSARRKERALEATRVAKSKKAKEDEEKLKVAAKLALMATGSGGVFDKAETGRKKLLGN